MVAFSIFFGIWIRILVKRLFENYVYLEIPKYHFPFDFLWSEALVLPLLLLLLLFLSFLLLLIISYHYCPDKLEQYSNSIDTDTNHSHTKMD